MLELSRGLSPAGLSALAELERRVIAVDGGRLKLEWGVLRGRTGRDVEIFLWWEDDRLRGFLGLYAFGGEVLEIAGMVDPATRRRGIATALLEAALPIARAQGYQRALLVTPRDSVAGRQLALGRGAVLDHSEHALALLDAPADGPADQRIELRTASRADASVLARLLDAAFGSIPSDVLDRPATDSERTLVVEFGGLLIGTLRVMRDQHTAGIYGFAVDPAWRGRGIGRDVLRRVCGQLRDQGVRRVELEVEVENDLALRLYTSLGFRPVTTEDYYALDLSSPQAPGGR